MSLGPAEILVVLVLALIVFGPKRLPEVGRQVGGALRELRKVQSTVETEIRSVLDDTTGPVRSMFDHEPTTHDQLRKELPTSDFDTTPSTVQPPVAPPQAEPDLGDEANDPGRSGIDGLSGGSFS